MSYENTRNRLWDEFWDYWQENGFKGEIMNDYNELLASLPEYQNKDDESYLPRIQLGYIYRHVLAGKLEDAVRVITDFDDGKGKWTERRAKAFVNRWRRNIVLKRFHMESEG